MSQASVRVARTRLSRTIATRFKWLVPGRIVLLYAGLLIVSYGSLLAFTWRDQLARVRPVRDVVAEHVVGLTTALRTASPASSAVVAAEAAPLAVDAEPPRPFDGSMVSERQEPLPEQTVGAGLVDTIALSNEVTTAADPFQRAKALVRLRNAASAPQAIEALALTLQSDPAVRNRLLAVAALRGLAAQGDDGSIGRVLQRAALDPDQRVAQLAVETYQTLPASTTEQ